MTTPRGDHSGGGDAAASSGSSSRCSTTNPPTPGIPVDAEDTDFSLVARLERSYQQLRKLHQDQVARYLPCLPGFKVCAGDSSWMRELVARSLMQHAQSLTSVEAFLPRGFEKFVGTSIGDKPPRRQRVIREARKNVLLTSTTLRSKLGPSGFLPGDTSSSPATSSASAAASSSLIPNPIAPAPPSLPPPGGPHRGRRASARGADAATTAATAAPYPFASGGLRQTPLSSVSSSAPGGGGGGGGGMAVAAPAPPAPSCDRDQLLKLYENCGSTPSERIGGFLSCQVGMLSPVRMYLQETSRRRQAATGSHALAAGFRDKDSGLYAVALGAVPNPPNSDGEATPMPEVPVSAARPNPISLFGGSISAPIGTPVTPFAARPLGAPAPPTAAPPSHLPCPPGEAQQGATLRIAAPPHSTSSSETPHPLPGTLEAGPWVGGGGGGVSSSSSSSSSSAEVVRPMWGLCVDSQADVGTEGLYDRLDGFLPLELFDDTEGRADEDGFVQLYDNSVPGGVVWAPCAVIGRDPATMFYNIDLEKDGVVEQRQVSRFQLRFADESVEEFNSRAVSLKALRRESERLVRAEFLLSMMGDDEDRSIDEYTLTRVLSKAAAKLPMSWQPRVREYLDQIVAEHFYAVRRGRLQYYMRSPKFLHQIAPLDVETELGYSYEVKAPPLPKDMQRRARFNSARSFLSKCFQVTQPTQRTLVRVAEAFAPYEKVFLISLTARSAKKKQAAAQQQQSQQQVTQPGDDASGDSHSASPSQPPHSGGVVRMGMLLATSQPADGGLPLSDPAASLLLGGSSAQAVPQGCVGVDASSCRSDGVPMQDGGGVCRGSAFLSRIVPFDEFCRMQSAHAKTMVKNKLIRWKTDVESALLATLKQRFKCNYPTESTYRASELGRFLKVVTYKMGSSLRQLLVQSIEKLLGFFEGFATPPSEGLAPSWRNDRYALLGLPPKNPNETCPLLGLSLKVLGPRNDTIGYEWGLQDIRQRMHAIVHDMVAVAVAVPSIERTFLSSLDLPDSYIPVIAENDSILTSAAQRIDAVFDSSVPHLHSLLSCYRELQPLLRRKEAGEDSTLYADLSDMSRLAGVLDGLLEQKRSVDRRSPDVVFCQVFTVDCSQAKAVLRERVTAAIEKHLSLAAKRVVATTTAATTLYNTLWTEMQLRPATAESFEAFRINTNRMREELLRVESEDFERVSYVRAEVLDRYNRGLTDEEAAEVFTMQEWPMRIRAALGESDRLLVEEEKEFIRQIHCNREALQEDLVAYREMVKELMAVSDCELTEVTAEKAQALRDLLGDAQRRSEQCQRHEAIFGLPRSEWPAIKDLQRESLPFYLLWRTAFQWSDQQPRCYETQVQHMDAQKLQLLVGEWHRTVRMSQRAVRGYPGPCQVAKKLEGEIATFHNHLPWIGQLTGPGIRIRHWKQVTQELRCPPNAEITVAHLIEHGIEQKRAFVAALAVQAAREAEVEAIIEGMKNEWKEHRMKFTEWSGCKVIPVAKAHDLLVVIDKHITSTQLLRLACLEAFENVARDWEGQLTRLQDILTNWIGLQETWTNLKPIFDNEEVCTGLGKEARLFHRAHKKWCSLMREADCVMRLISLGEEFLDRLIDVHTQLLEVQKGLASFLDVKRCSWARFYWLADDAILQMLAASGSDISAVDEHLPKCFGCVQSLVHDPETLHITAVTSSTGEQLQLAHPVETVGKGLDRWLENLDVSISDTLALVFPRCVQEHGTTGLAEWIDNWPEQLLLLAMRVVEHNDITEMLDMTNGARGLRALSKRIRNSVSDATVLLDYSHCVEAALAEGAEGAGGSDSHSSAAPTPSPSPLLAESGIHRGPPQRGSPTLQAAAEVSDHVRTPLVFSLGDGALGGARQRVLGMQPLTFDKVSSSNETPSDGGGSGRLLTSQRRVLLEKLVQSFLTTRQRLDVLIDEGVETPQDFTYSFMVKHTMRCERVAITTGYISHPYRYEFLGHRTPIVCTPVTIRAQRSMILTLASTRAPILLNGPSGVGKLTLVQDLAALLGLKCVVLSCSDQIPWEVARNTLSGALSCGAMCVLLGMDLLQGCVLSRLTTALCNIYSPASARLERVELDKWSSGDAKVSLHRCFVLAGIRQQACGRASGGTAFPEGLSQHFRVCHMVTPDTEMIAMQKLFVAGCYTMAEKFAQCLTLLLAMSQGILSLPPPLVLLEKICSVVQARSKQRVELEPSTATADWQEFRLVACACYAVAVAQLRGDEFETFGVMFEKCFAEYGPLIHRSRVTLAPSEETTLEIFDSKRDVVTINDTPYIPSQGLLPHIETLLQLLSFHRTLIIWGKSSSGKTALIDLLGACFKTPPTVHCIVPGSMPLSTLQGRLKEGGRWEAGVLPTLLRKSLPDHHTWLVMDGGLGIADKWHGLLRDEPAEYQCLSGERIQLSPRGKIIFEATHIMDVTPGVITRCALFAVPQESPGEWRGVFKSMILRSSEGIRKLFGAFSPQIFTFSEVALPPCLEYLKRAKCKFPVHPFVIARRIALLYCAILDQITTYADTSDASVVYVEVPLAHAAILIVSQCLDDTACKDFLEAVIQWLPSWSPLLLRALPTGACITECYPCDGRWVRLAENTQLEAAVAAVQGSYASASYFCPSTAFLRIAYHHELLSKSGVAFAVTGGPGTGKTGVLHKILAKSQNCLPIFSTVSRTCTAEALLHHLVLKLTRRRQGVVGPPLGTSCVVALDDMHIADPNPTTPDSLHEALLALVKMKKWWGPQATQLVLTDTSFIGTLCTGGPSGARDEKNVSARLASHFVIFHLLDEMSPLACSQILSNIFVMWKGPTFFNLGMRLSDILVQLWVFFRDNFEERDDNLFLWRSSDVFRVARTIVSCPSSRLTKTHHILSLMTYEIHARMGRFLVLSDLLQSDQKILDAISAIMRVQFTDTALKPSQLLYTVIGPMSPEVVEALEASQVVSSGVQEPSVPEVGKEAFEAHAATQITMEELVKLVQSYANCLHTACTKALLQPEARGTIGGNDAVILASATAARQRQQQQQQKQMQLPMKSKARQAAAQQAQAAEKGGGWEAKGTPASQPLSDSMCSESEAPQAVSIAERVRMKSRMASLAPFTIDSSLALLVSNVVRGIQPTRGHCVVSCDQGDEMVLAAELACFILGYSVVDDFDSRGLDWAERRESVFKKTMESTRGVAWILHDNCMADNMVADIALMVASPDLCGLIPPALNQALSRKLLEDSPNERQRTLVSEKICNTLHIVLLTRGPESGEVGRWQREFPALVTSALFVSLREFVITRASCVQYVASLCKNAAFSLTRPQLERVSEAMHAVYKGVAEQRGAAPPPSTFRMLAVTFCKMYGIGNHDLRGSANRYSTVIRLIESVRAQGEKYLDDVETLTEVLKEIVVQRGVLQADLITWRDREKEKQAAFEELEASCLERVESHSRTREECKALLGVAVPAFEQAKDNLKSISEKELAAVRCIGSPAPVVRRVMEAICLVMGEKVDRSTRSGGDVVWSVSQQALADPNFIQKLTQVGPKKMHPKMIAQLTECVSHPTFKVAKAQSTNLPAVVKLCTFLLKLEEYLRTVTIVNPKQEVLQRDDAHIKVLVDALEAKRHYAVVARQQFESVEASLQQLDERHITITNFVEQCRQRHSNSEFFVKHVNDTSLRWYREHRALSVATESLTGLCVCAAYTAVFYPSAEGLCKIHRNVLMERVAEFLKLPAKSAVRKSAVVPPPTPPPHVSPRPGQYGSGLGDTTSCNQPDPASSTAGTSASRSRTTRLDSDGIDLSLFTDHAKSTASLGQPPGDAGPEGLADMDLQSTLFQKDKLERWVALGHLPDTHLIRENVAVALSCVCAPVFADTHGAASHWLDHAFPAHRRLKGCSEVTIEFVELCMRKGIPAVLEVETISVGMTPLLRILVRGYGTYRGRRIRVKAGFRLFFIRAAIMRGCTEWFRTLSPEVSQYLVLLSFQLPPAEVRRAIGRVVTTSISYTMSEEREECMAKVVSSAKRYDAGSDKLLEVLRTCASEENLWLPEERGDLMDLPTADLDTPVPHIELTPTLLKDTELMKSLTSEVKVVEASLLQYHTDRDAAAEFDSTLLEKFELVVSNIQLVFGTLEKLSDINPLYKMSFLSLMEIVKREVRCLADQCGEKIQHDWGRVVEPFSRDVLSVLYKITAAGLFHEHRAVYAFLMAVEIERRSEAITQQEWALFSHMTLEDSAEKNSKKRIVDVAEKLAGQLRCFRDLPSALEKKYQVWVPFLEGVGEPPTMWRGHLSQFQYIILVKHLSPSMLKRAMLAYAAAHIPSVRHDTSVVSVFRDALFSRGVRPTFPVLLLHRASSPTICREELQTFAAQIGGCVVVPIPFEPGEDHLTRLRAYITDCDYHDRTSDRDALWLLLQDFHRYSVEEREVVSWMVTDCRQDTPDARFRIFIEVGIRCARDVPSSLARSSLKLVAPTATGVKAAVVKHLDVGPLTRQTFMTFTDGASERYHRLICLLSVLHAVMLHRASLPTPYGWIEDVSWTDRDLKEVAHHVEQSFRDTGMLYLEGLTNALLCEHVYASGGEPGGAVLRGIFKELQGVLYREVDTNVPSWGVSGAGHTRQLVWAGKLPASPPNGIFSISPGIEFTSRRADMALLVEIASKRIYSSAKQFPIYLAQRASEQVSEFSSSSTTGATRRSGPQQKMRRGHPSLTVGSIQSGVGCSGMPPSEQQDEGDGGSECCLSEQSARCEDMDLLMMLVDGMVTEGAVSPHGGAQAHPGERSSAFTEVPQAHIDHILRHQERVHCMLQLQKLRESLTSKPSGWWATRGVPPNLEQHLPHHLAPAGREGAPLGFLLLTFEKRWAFLKEWVSRRVFLPALSYPLSVLSGMAGVAVRQQSSFLAAPVGAEVDADRVVLSGLFLGNAVLNSRGELAPSEPRQLVASEGAVGDFELATDEEPCGGSVAVPLVISASAPPLPGGRRGGRAPPGGCQHVLDLLIPLASTEDDGYSVFSGDMEGLSLKDESVPDKLTEGAACSDWGGGVNQIPLHMPFMVSPLVDAWS